MTTLAATPPVLRPTAEQRDDRRLLAGAGVLLLGLFADGWAHTNIIEDLESFLSPYHALIFAGYLGCVTAVGAAIARDRTPGSSFAAAVPRGYGPAVAAVAAFAVGFLGDGVWHTLFGIEAGIDALLSPTHLLMYGSMMVLFTTPWSTAAHRPAPTSWRDQSALVGGTIAATLATAFFLLYLWSPIRFGPLHATFDHELAQSAWLSGSYVTTAVLVLPVVLLARRLVSWPAGLATTLLLVVGTAMAAIHEFDRPEALLAFLVAGVSVDVVLARDVRHRLVVAGALLPLALWSTWWLVLGLTAEIQWAAELWSGQIVFATLVGGGLALLATPRDA